MKSYGLFKMRLLTGFFLLFFCLPARAQHTWSDDPSCGTRLVGEVLSYGLMVFHLEELAWLEGDLPFSDQWSILDYQIALEDPEVKGIRIDYNGGIVGLILFRVIDDGYEILRLLVSERARRQGVGGALVQQALGYLDRSNRNQIEIAVSEYAEGLQLLLAQKRFTAVRVEKPFPYSENKPSYYVMRYRIDRRGKYVLPTPEFHRLNVTHDGVIRRK
jgi:ribosomal protein S18 acetylase RimI-like enzyme